jgi:glutathione S-transferase
MTIIITAFERSPDGGKGLGRDTRICWALDEVGQPYEVRLVSFRTMKEPAHRTLHPFGKIPTYEEGDLALFETGRSCSISLSAIRACCRTTPMPGARSHGCLPHNKVEPPILERETARLPEGGETWHEERLPLVDRVRDRLDQLSPRLGDGHSGRISEPGRLCRPRRSAARLQTSFRRSIGGFHRPMISTCAAPTLGQSP